MIQTLRTLALWVAAAVVAAFGAASVGTYRPGGVTDRVIAVEDLKRALNLLDAKELDSAARLAAYRDGLTRADARLRLAIRSNPADTASIERLAMVRWESSVLAGGPDADSVLSLVSIAAARAPRVPEIQADLGALLYKMGSPAEAAPFMKRAVQLSPAMTNRVVATMQDAGVDPRTTMRLLPRTAEVMIALRESFERIGDLSEWLSPVEQMLPDFSGSLIASYADGCLAANAPDRLLLHMSALGVLGPQGAEAERQIAIGRAHVRQQAWDLAAVAAKEGQRLAVGDPRLLELVGQVALAAGDAGLAEVMFRDALGALAVGASRGLDRARLYRRRGEALERLGRVDDAFDDYRRAVEILPDDKWLRRRFAGWDPGTRPRTGP